MNKKKLGERVIDGDFDNLEAYRLACCKDADYSESKIFAIVMTKWWNDLKSPHQDIKQEAIDHIYSENLETDCFILNYDYNGVMKQAMIRAGIDWTQYAILRKYHR